MLLQLADVLLEGTHLQFVTHHMDDISPRHNAQFRIKRFHHLNVGVVYAIQDNRVYIFNDNMLL